MFVSTVSRDDKLCTGWGLIVDFIQVGPQFGEDGDNPRFVAGVMGSLGAADSYPLVFPIHFPPAPKDPLRRVFLCASA
jgi:hypothetical protein